jgi:acyl-CoA dehydrogenase
MDFGFSDEEASIQASVRRFGNEFLRPRERMIDEGDQIPRDVASEMGRIGILAMPVPEAYGGMGASAAQTELVAEEIGRADTSMATAVFFLLEAGWGYLLSKYGTEAARKEVLPPVTRGEHFLGIASTEPGGGSDIAGEQTLSWRDGDDFVLQGEKAFISGVIEARDWGGGHLTITRQRDGKGMNLLYVPTRTQGVTVGRFKNMGRMGISTGSLTYDEARVPARYLIGTEGRGLPMSLEGFTVARTFVAAACVGAAERALEIGKEYVKVRQVFGKPLGKYEGIQFELADLHAEIEAVKWQCRKAAWLVDQRLFSGKSSHDSEVDLAVAAVKLMAPELAFDTFKKVMMWHGASGYTKDVGLEMGLRGVTSYLVGAEGGLNVMRLIMARELLGKEFLPYR